MIHQNNNNNNHESIESIIKQCKELLKGENKLLLRSWEEVYRNETVINKQERFKNTIALTANILEKYKIVEHKSLLTHIIHCQKYVKKKILAYLYSLMNFAAKDSECKFMLNLINDPEIHEPHIHMYLRTRAIIIPHILNRKKKSQLNAVICTLQEWFGLISDIFNGVNRKLLLEKFTEIVKRHYLDIKKQQNSNMNGSEIFQICQKLLIEFPDAFIIKTKRSTITSSQSNFSKTTQNFVNEAVLTELYNEDKIVAKMISNQNKQIDDILEERQDQMIEVITEEVNELRMNLETQRTKIRQLLDREKYFIMMLKNIKSEFYEMASFLQSNRLQHKSINKLLQLFLEFEQNIEKKQSEQGKSIRLRMEELSLIRRITEEQSKFISHV